MLFSLICSVEENMRGCKFETIQHYQRWVFDCTDQAICSNVAQKTFLALQRILAA